MQIKGNQGWAPVLHIALDWSPSSKKMETSFDATCSIFGKALTRSVIA